MWDTNLFIYSGYLSSIHHNIGQDITRIQAGWGGVEEGDQSINLGLGQHEKNQEPNLNTKRCVRKGCLANLFSF